MIRRARQDDWEAARALWREVDDLHAGLAPAYFRQAARADADWRVLLASGDAAVLVADGAAPGGLAGLVSVRVYDTPPDPAMVPLRRGHVEILVVSAASRRRGVGTSLMTEAASWARRRGAAELVLTVWEGNEAAASFYARLGYEVLSRVLHAKL